MRRRFRLIDEGSFLSESPLLRKLSLWAGGIFILLIAGVIYLFVITRDLPSFKQLEEYEPKLASKVYSADMKVIHEYFVEKRSFVPLEAMPEELIKAVISTEDRKFFDHWGFDLQRFAKAVIVNIINLSYEQGASTLTQQLARQLYMEKIGLEKTISRKIKELITAIQIERTYTKEEILEMYLNHINFGHGAYGAQSGAYLYFGKELKDLTVDECALLVGILVAPTRYSPLRHPERAEYRRNIALASMRDLGHLTEEEYQKYVEKPIQVLQRENYNTSVAPYFTEHIRKELQDKYGYDLYTDGLSIYTTLDTRAQAIAEDTVASHLEKFQKEVNNYYTKTPKNFKLLLDESFAEANDVEKLMQDSTFVDSVLTEKATVQVALISIDPRNGHILAYIGGRDFSKSKFNRVVQGQGRQPGSAFKPFVYTVAIDNGYPTTTEVLNQPVVTFTGNDERWTPQNYDLSVGGPTTFREGLRRSLNLVTVRVLQDLIQNPSLVVEYAHRMGIKSKLDAVDAIALGASNVTPQEITSAFGVFANSGVHVEPMYILRVEDKNGNIIEQNLPNRREALRKETAYIMTDMLQTVMNEGTGASARWKYGFTRPAGGKTGTTNDYSDAWFIGFTRQIVTGIWIGMDDFIINLPPKSDGASTALPVWAPYMKAVHDSLNLPVLEFQMPDGVKRVEICDDTKRLANDVCPNILEEVFFAESVPTRYCNVHVGLSEGRTKRSREKERIRF